MNKSLRIIIVGGLGALIVYLFWFNSVQSLIGNQPTNTDYSVVYKMGYEDLREQLVYAKLTSRNLKAQEYEPQLVADIRDKDQLIDIVRHFDQVIVSPEIEVGELDDSITRDFVLTIWREGKPVTHVFFESKDKYYYGSPIIKNPERSWKFRVIPDSLVNLMGIK